MSLWLHTYSQVVDQCVSRSIMKQRIDYVGAGGFIEGGSQKLESSSDTENQNNNAVEQNCQDQWNKS